MMEGRRQEASRIYADLRARFPDSELAPHALFEMGKLGAEAGREREGHRAVGGGAEDAPGPGAGAGLHRPGAPRIADTTPEAVGQKAAAFDHKHAAGPRATRWRPWAARPRKPRRPRRLTALAAVSARHALQHGLQQRAPARPGSSASATSSRCTRPRSTRASRPPASPSRPPRPGTAASHPARARPPPSPSPGHPRRRRGCPRRRR